MMEYDARSRTTLRSPNVERGEAQPTTAVPRAACPVCSRTYTGGKGTARRCGEPRRKRLDLPQIGTVTNYTIITRCNTGPDRTEPSHGARDGSTHRVVLAITTARHTNDDVRIGCASLRCGVRRREGRNDARARAISSVGCDRRARRDRPTREPDLLMTTHGADDIPSSDGRSAMVRQHRQTEVQMLLESSPVALTDAGSRAKRTHLCRQLRLRGRSGVSFVQNIDALGAWPPSVTPTSRWTRVGAVRKRGSAC